MNFDTCCRLLCAAQKYIYIMEPINQIEKSGNKTDGQVAISAFEACELSTNTLRKATWSKRITFRDYSEILVYKNVIRDNYPDCVGNVLKCIKFLMLSPAARMGLLQMVNICITLIDIVCFCKINVFTSNFETLSGSYELTKWLQFLMSKCCRNVIRAAG